MQTEKTASELRSRRFVLKSLAGAAALAALPFPACAETAAGKNLILFFSRTGHTRTLAGMIRRRAGGDMLELKTAKPYPRDYNDAIKLAKKEQKENARPALATELPPLDGYGAVFLGYPNWWGTMPMALFTLLEQHDFSGRTLIPFCTHGGSRLGRSVEDIRKLCPNARLLEGFAAFGDSVDQAGKGVDAWLQKIGMLQAAG